MGQGRGVRFNRIKYQVLLFGENYPIQPYRVGAVWLEGGSAEKDLRMLKMSQHVPR